MEDSYHIRYHRLILYFLILITLLSFQDTVVFAGDGGERGATGRMIIDDNGVMRWEVTGEEVALFGVNYSIPFAHGYRAVNYIGAGHEDVIDQDVYHFARMGLDAYRIHVWDIEISNREGDLVYNNHLRLLDYLIKRLKERDFKIVLTLMRNSDNSYPEYDEEVLAYGFSRYTPKMGLLAHHTEEGIAAQERYARAFVNHVNEYTGLSYKDDPDIIAFEINNEPHHSSDPGEVRDYINRMVAAMRETGMDKPIFYNMSHNFDVTDAFLTADIQGGTFQWYPTGLNAGFTQKGNFLPNVDTYSIPFSDDPRFQRMGKLIYEFDPSDVTDNYMYPAMVRSFRSEGFQFITQFAYDAMALANINSEYRTHHLNLAHTPSKGISFRIASEAARRVPPGADYGTWPESAEFEDIRVSYEENLAEMVTDEAFYYSNNTQSRPENPVQLRHLAGTGSSPLIRYEGTGAYFLDKLEDGIWRLEVMPDVVMINDPFDDPHPDKEVTRILWNRWPMVISLPDLGADFFWRGVDKGNHLSGKADGNRIPVSPGVYILTRNGVDSEHVTGEERFGNITVNEFVAPPPGEIAMYDVVHKPVDELSPGRPLTIRAEIAGVPAPERVELVYSHSETGEPRPSETMHRMHRDIEPFQRMTMQRTGGYTWEAELPDSLITPGGGILYYIVIRNGGEYTTFPGEFNSFPGNWDFYNREYYGTRFVERDAPLPLLRVEKDYSRVMPLRSSYGSPGRKSLTEGSSPGSRAIRVDADLESHYLFFLREYIGDQIRGREGDPDHFSHVVIHARAVEGNTGTLQFGFLTTDGFTYGAPFRITGEWRDIRIPLSEFEQTDTALRLTYPRMMEPYFTPETEIPFDINKIENWEISTAGHFNREQLSYKVENIWLE